LEQLWNSCSQNGFFGTLSGIAGGNFMLSFVAAHPQCIPWL